MGQRKGRKTTAEFVWCWGDSEGGKCLFCRWEDPGHIALQPNKFISVISGGREESG